MTIKELEEIDKEFTETTFISKVDNTFIMILSSIMLDDLDKVKHKISDNLFNRYKEMLLDLNNKNLRQMYDELNVKDSYIESIEKTDNSYRINVILDSRYMDYRADKTTFKYVDGINDRRIEKRNHLVFEKKFNTKENKIVRKCPGCGASLDINSTGVCPYCKSIYDMENYDYILVDMY